MGSTAVDSLYNEFRQMSLLFSSAGEVSLGVSLDNNFRKSLVLAAASYFEHRVTTDVIDFSRDSAGLSPLIPSFIKNKAVSRQYHTWFDWERSNANSFFSLFGQEFRSHMESAMKKNSAVSKYISDFMSIGLTRNRLAHQNYATISLEKTADEIYIQYLSALKFVDMLPSELRIFAKTYSKKRVYRTIRCKTVKLRCRPKKVDPLIA